MLPQNQKALDAFFALLTVKVSPSSKKLYVRNVKNFLEAVNKPYAQIKKTDVIDYLGEQSKLLEKKSVDWEYKREGISQKTVNVFLSSLTLFFHEQKMFQLCEDLKSLRMKSKDRHKKIAVQLTEDEIDAMIHTDITKNEFQNERNKLIVAFLVSTGMRRSELATLPVSDLRLDEPFSGDNRVITITGKGDKQRRIVVPNWLLAAYKKFRSAHNGSTPVLFWSQKSPVMSPHTIWYIVKQKAAMANLPEKKQFSIRYNSRLVHPHLFRSTYATDRLDAGDNVMKVKDLLGHSSLVTTNKYVRISDENLAKTKQRKWL